MATKQFDYLAEVSRLMDALRVEGLKPEADQLQQCIEAGATGTEILMALRWNLQKMMQSSPSLSDVTKSRARQVLAGIDLLLK